MNRIATGCQKNSGQVQESQIDGDELSLAWKIFLISILCVGLIIAVVWSFIGIGVPV
ncbi:hypothetical protein GCM10023157_04420 [Gluconacetobacter asukensis]